MLYVLRITYQLLSCSLLLVGPGRANHFGKHQHCIVLPQRLASLDLFIIQFEKKSNNNSTYLIISNNTSYATFGEEELAQLEGMSVVELIFACLSLLVSNLQSNYLTYSILRC